MTTDIHRSDACAHCDADLEGASTRICDEGCREPICERCYSDRAAPECPEALERVMGERKELVGRDLHLYLAARLRSKGGILIKAADALDAEPAERIAELEAALEDLTAACESDFVSEGGDPEFPDNEAVASGDCAITYGHIRRARKALRGANA